MRNEKFKIRPDHQKIFQHVLSKWESSVDNYRGKATDLKLDGDSDFNLGKVTAYLQCIEDLKTFCIGG